MRNQKMTHVGGGYPLQSSDARNLFSRPTENGARSNGELSMYLYGTPNSLSKIAALWAFLQKCYDLNSIIGKASRLEYFFVSVRLQNP